MCRLRRRGALRRFKQIRRRRRHLLKPSAVSRRPSAEAPAERAHSPFPIPHFFLLIANFMKVRRKKCSIPTKVRCKKCDVSTKVR